MVRSVSAVARKRMPVDSSLVLQGNVGDLVRQGKNDMKVGTVEKFRLPVLKPLGTGQGLAFGTVAVRTRVVPHALVAAPVTHFDVTAESGRAARLNRLHHTPLCGR